MRRQQLDSPAGALPQYRQPFATPTNPGLLTLLLIAMLAALYGFLFAAFAEALLLPLTIPLLILAAVVVWVLPETRRGPLRALEWLFFGFLIVLLIWPDYLAISFPGLPWITFRRLFAGPMALILLICISVSAAVREDIKRVIASEPLVTKLIIAFAILQLLSIALSRDPSRSVERFIVAQLYWTAMFFAGCYIFLKPGRVARWAAIFCLLSIPLALIGLYEWANSRVPWADRIPALLKVEDESVQRVLAGTARAATGEYRVQSTHTTSLGYAEFLALTTPFLIHYVVGSFSTLVRLAALIALPVTFWMILLTDSRLGVVGFFLAALLYPAAWAVLRWKRAAGSLFGPAITLAYPVIFVLFLVASVVFGRLRRIMWGGGEHAASTEGRKMMYDKGLDIIAGNPIGHGVGMGAETLGVTNLAGILTIDTYYLLIALEYGVLGFLIYYGYLIIAVIRSAATLMTGRLPDQETLYLIPLSIAILSFIVIKSVFSQDANHPIIYMMLAAMLALIVRHKEASAATG